MKHKFELIEQVKWNNKKNLKMLQSTKNIKPFLTNTHLHRLEFSMAQTIQTCKAELRSHFFVVMSLKTKKKK